MGRRGINIVVIDKATGQIKSSAVLFGEEKPIQFSTMETFAFWNGIDEGIYHLCDAEDKSILHNIQILYCKDGEYYIRNKDGLYLTVSNGENTSGCPAVWEEYSGFADQLWMINKTNQDRVQIWSLFNHLKVDISDKGITLYDRSIEDLHILSSQDKKMYEKEGV